MRQAGTIADERLAKRFADYLLTQGIATRVDAETDGWVIWVRDEEFVDQSRATLQEFLDAPDDPKFQGVSREAGAIRAAERRREKEYSRNQIDMRRRWKSPAGGSIPVTMTFLGLMLLATVVSRLGKYEPVSKWLFIATYTFTDPNTGETVNYLPEVMKGQVWRLVTPIFMHGGVLHLIFGLWMFYHFGRLIEVRRGSYRMLAMVLTIAVISNIAEYLVADFREWPNGIFETRARFLGMSGVIYGLFGFAWIRGKYDPTSGLRLNPQVVFFLIAWLVFCMLGFMPIANIAHVSGLLVGMAIGYAPVGWQHLGGRVR